MTMPRIAAPEYDSVELRTGRLQRIRRAEARVLGDADGMALVAKCSAGRPLYFQPSISAIWKG